MQRVGAFGPLGQEAFGHGGGFREGLQGAGDIGRGQGEGLKAGEAEVTFALMGKQRGEEVEAGAKAKLGDLEAVAEAVGQAVAGKEHVAGFGKAAAKREIGIIEAARDGDRLITPVKLGWGEFLCAC